jgi:hypothetical protein
MDENCFEEKVEELIEKKYGLKCVYRKPMGQNTIVLSFTLGFADEEEQERILSKIQDEELIRNSDASAYIANIAGRDAGPAIQVMFDEQ